MTPPSNADVVMAGDVALLPEVVAAVEAAGKHMLAGFRTETSLVSVVEIAAAIQAGDLESLGVMRPLLELARPDAGWVEDELADGALPGGEWWVADPVEGAINYVHGIGEWAITATLVRHNQPVLTVVHLPLEAVTYSAARGQGAFYTDVFRGSRKLSVSVKTDLGAALVGTGQASPRETRQTFELIGRSLPAMMEACGATRVSVPPTLQLIHVAAGRMDVFWQYSAVRSGLLAGALLVSEAGGTVSDISGRPWSLAATDFLAAAPGLHGAASRTLTAAS